ncbi:hypothetical protein [Sinorhizobium americanum]|uniref:Uncharacterized protein n=1 Tax=Sinorhizobium americanum TaxID=194963 RepID=A0A1L3LJD6_9HYPH|nr:hypothetical protein [Sinorhizobium americanum]APG83672.1 hypothetical protein SAMCCGM7_Ch0891 [Sinorhizobium americanum CCGM7]APG90211.1 hypothetical protein SAMCFNEI73_Ch0889 [Sinorhizobium americanum]OAP49722.1 hypothetical protein ATC00_09890 [Sinorhizobium americanum]
MSSLATFINAVAFTALFAAHASAAPVERPAGVRRALQIYAGELTNSASMRLEPMWRLDGSEFFCLQHMLASGASTAKRHATMPCGRKLRLA